jgi:signal transduction histidine kinase
MIDAPKLAPLHVLVVEDDLIYRTLVVNALRHQAPQGQVDAVGTLAEALRFLERQPVDAVILDLNLPDSAGAATYDRILTDYPEIATIVLSAEEDEALAVAAVRSGAQDYLVKNFTEPLRILHLTQHAVERHRHKLAEVEAGRRAERSQRMIALGTMACGIVHEYNNLDTVLLVTLESMLPLAAGPELTSRIQRCLDTVKRASRISRGLRDFARDNRRDLDRLDLREVVAESLPLLEPILEHHEVHLTTRLPQQPVLALGNPAQLGQVLLNLAVNACHAMAGRAQRELRIGVEADDSQALLWVEDSGCGMTEATQQRIFEPFFTTKGGRGLVRDAQPLDPLGAGLGLSVSDIIVRHHGGRIQVSSARDHGTRMTVHLPQVESMTPLASPVLTGEGQPDDRLDGIEVFVIDSDPRLLDQASAQLRACGCVPSTTGLAPVALKLIKRRAPDVVLFGSEIESTAAHPLSAPLGLDPPSARIPIVALMASGSRRPEEHIDARICSVLRKPFTPAQLRAALVRALAAKERATR